MNPQAQPGFAAAATYDPAVALEFFKSAGRPAAIGEGEKIFAPSAICSGRPAALKNASAIAGS